MPVLPTVLASSNSVRDLAALPLTIDGRAWFSELKLKVGAATNTEQSGGNEGEKNRVQISCLGLPQRFGVLSMDGP